MPTAKHSETGRVYRVTLADGRSFEIESRCRLRFWKSDLMRRIPYGEHPDWTLARFEIVDGR
jgi:hypothetical protein